MTGLLASPTALTAGIISNKLKGKGAVAPESPGGSKQFTGIDPSATSGARRRVRKRQLGPGDESPRPVKLGGGR